MSVTEEAVPRVNTPVVTDRDVLHRAADLLEEFGWTRGIEGVRCVAEGVRGPYCLLGAVAQARLDFGEPQPQHGLMGEGFYDFARERLGTTSMDEDWRWNDRPHRTKAEVVARPREAAEA